MVMNRRRKEAKKSSPPAHSSRRRNNRNDSSPPRKEPKHDRLLQIVLMIVLGVSLLLLLINGYLVTLLDPFRKGKVSSPAGLDENQEFVTFRMRGRKFRGKPAVAGSIHDIIRDASIDNQLSHHHNNPQQAAGNGGAWGDVVMVSNDGQQQAEKGTDQNRGDQPNSCDQLFGPMGIHLRSQCLEHTVLKWVVCPLPSIRLHMENIKVSFGNDTAESVLGRSEKDETIAWDYGMMEIGGEIPRIQLQAPLTERAGNFLFDFALKSSLPIVPEDDILTVFVFRETYDSTEQEISLMQHTYEVLRHLDVTDNFRILFMDGHARTNTDEAWVELFGGSRVFHLRNFVTATGITTFGKGIVVQPIRSALGEDAALYYNQGDKCVGRSYLLDFRNELLEKYKLRITKRNATETQNRTVTLLYSKPFLSTPRVDLSDNWTEPELDRVRDAVCRVYKVEDEHVRIVTLDGLSFREQISILSETDLLLSPYLGTALMSMFLSEGAKFYEFCARPTKRLKYILRTLGIDYDSGPMPVAIRDSNIYGPSRQSQNITNDDLMERSRLPTWNCDQLLGWDAIRTNGTCRTHTVLEWTLCEIPPLHFILDKIKGARGNESVQEVMGRTGAEERLSFGFRSVEALGTLNPVMVGSCLSLDEVQDFWMAVNPLPGETLFDGASVDKIPTMLVFRESYANPCWSILMAYQTWLMMKLFDVGDEFRILWMDGHAYIGVDDFWRDVFGSNVDHFLNFVSRSGIAAFEKLYVVHAGRSALGNEALLQYHFGSSCAPNSTLHDFRRWVLDKYGYMDEGENRTKTEKQLTFLVRRNYVAHPRSNGIADRTIHDLNETIDALQLKYPDHTIHTVAFEGISFREQLRIIRNTDLLVSVHGAGNIHVLFLPSHAQFIEFYPYEMSGRKRFQFIANALNISRKFVMGGIYRKVDNIIEMSLADYIPSLPQEIL